MNLSISSSGFDAASAVFETAANGIPRAASSAANDIYSAGSTLGSSVSVSTAVAVLAKKNLDFTANSDLQILDNATNQSTFSVTG